MSTEKLPGSAIVEVEALSLPASVCVDGLELVRTGQWKFDRLEAVPHPAPLQLTSLAALLQWFKEEGFGEEFGHPWIIIESPTVVSAQASGRVGRAGRYVSARATAQFTTKGFGQWMDQEGFIIWVRTQFQQSDDLATLLMLASKVSAEGIEESDDTGVSQMVRLKAGVLVGGATAVQSTFSLAAYRTFPEVVQPQSLFLFRVRKFSGGVQMALFEADGGAWVLEAREDILEYIRNGIGSFIEGKNLASRVL